MSKTKTPSWVKSPAPAPAEAAPETPVNHSPNQSSKNALKHGCCAVGTLILPHENESDYKALEATWFQAYNPTCDAERHLVQELVNADWLLQRTTAAYLKIEAECYLIITPSDWDDIIERKLARHMRYRTAQSNLVVKARKAVEDFRKNRRSEQAHEVKQAIAQERLEIYKAKTRTLPAAPEPIPYAEEKAPSFSAPAAPGIEHPQRC